MYTIGAFTELSTPSSSEGTYPREYWNTLLKSMDVLSVMSSMVVKMLPTCMYHDLLIVAKALWLMPSSWMKKSSASEKIDLMIRYDVAHHASTKRCLDRFSFSHIGFLNYKYNRPSFFPRRQFLIVLS